jgi:hypothetical protein
MPARHFASPDPASLEAWIQQLLRLTGACASTLPGHHHGGDRSSEGAAHGVTRARTRLTRSGLLRLSIRGQAAFGGERSPRDLLAHLQGFPDFPYPLDMSNVDLPALYAEFESRAFPESLTVWEHGDLTVTSNSAGHAIVLAESEEFWEDDDGSAAEAAWAHLESLCREYEVAATAAWGAPHRVDITHRLGQG